MSRARLAGVCAIAALLAGCTVGQKGADAGAATGGSADAAPVAQCNLPLYPSDYSHACQPWLDSTCCDQERACVDNPDCTTLVACFNACSPPRTDACIQACTANGNGATGYTQLNAVGDCAKAASGQPPGCGWPQQ